MGWCNGTELFDATISIAHRLQTGKISFREFVRLLVVHYQDADWDCESDSEYWVDIVRPAMLAMGQLDDQD